MGSGKNRREPRAWVHPPGSRQSLDPQGQLPHKPYTYTNVSQVGKLAKALKQMVLDAVTCYVRLRAIAGIADACFDVLRGC